MKENKLIIGVSIVFCTIILIIGTTIAYFTQSDTKETGEIVSTDEVTLEYNDDNNSYMLGDLIPINETDIETAYNNKCKDSNNYNVCSIYRFTISNTADVTQKLVINMIPTLNSFHNLKYYLYEINNGTSNKVKEKQPLTYDNKTPITLFNNLNLDNGSSKTYELVFYINNNPNANQNIEDAGKKFGAQISINSITTGEYVSKEIGESCYKVKQIGTENTDTTYYSETMSEELFEKYKGTYILTEFYGIDETVPEKPKAVEGCGVTQDDNGFYSVTVPSKIGDKEIKILGNNLFTGLNSNETFNEKSKIKYIEIDDGIEVLEDSNMNELKGTFLGIGIYFENDNCSNVYMNRICLYNYNFNIKLPYSLKYIGIMSFWMNSISEIKIPRSVETINKIAFGGKNGARKLTKLIFEGAEDNTSNLKTIGEGAFARCNLTYTSPLNPLIIPSSVTEMEYGAFNSNASGTDINPQNRYLNYIKFKGTLTAGNTDWYDLETNGGATKEILR